MDLVKLIKVYQSHFQLKKYFYKEDEDDKKHVTSVLCEKNNTFIEMLRHLCDYHMRNKTDFSKIVPEFEPGYALVDAELKKESIYNPLNIIIIAKLMEIVFIGLKYMLKALRKALDSTKDSMLKHSLNMLVVNDICIILYLLLLDTEYMPPELKSDIQPLLKINPENEENILSKCKTIIRRSSIGKEIYICDFNPKIDLNQNKDTGSSPVQIFSEYIERKTKLVTKSSNKLMSLISDNIPVSSPYAVLILIAMIKTLRSRSGTGFTL